MHIQYTVSLKHHIHHRLTVEILLSEPPPGGMTLYLPTWTPGSYLIREHAKNILSISAYNEKHQQITCQKLNKSSWRLHYDNQPDVIRVVYEVYAHDPSVRSCFANDIRAFWDGAALMLAIDQHESNPHFLTIADIPSEWEVATSMPPANGSPQTLCYSKNNVNFYAEDYFTFIDHPFECARLIFDSFTVGNCFHGIAISGRQIHDIDRAKLTSDLKTLCLTHIQFFDPTTAQSPNTHYLFLVNTVQEGYGGLEHRSSTALMISQSHLPTINGPSQPAQYNDFLGLCSHEYFHQWWGKRIKPQEFSQPNLNSECYTELLWVFEGWTSYYDDLLLLRSQLISTDEYLKIISRYINRYQQTPGRTVQSLAMSSWDAWIKLYRPSENDINDSISYYLKGALVALCIDLWIRSKTQQQHSLDDVIRNLWKSADNRNNLSGQGVTEHDILSSINMVSGCDFSFVLNEWVHTTDEIPIIELLSTAGVSPLPQSTSTGVSHQWGWKLSNDGNQPYLTIKQIFVNQPAYLAGLNVGDELVAFNNQKASLARLQQFERTHPIGACIEITFFRDGYLMSSTIQSATAHKPIVLQKTHANDGSDNWPQAVS